VNADIFKAMERFFSKRFKFETASMIVEEVGLQGGRVHSLVIVCVHADGLEVVVRQVDVLEDKRRTWILWVVVLLIILPSILLGYYWGDVLEQQ